MREVGRPERSIGNRLADRYGTPNVASKVLWSVVALAMITVGAIWTVAGSGTASAIGPIVAGLGVALGYVVLIQKRR